MYLRGIADGSWGQGNILAYTIALGVGVSRATGFGHVSIKPLRESEKKTRETRA
jgi:hypothetical protein